VTDEGAKKALTLLFGTQAMGRPYVAPPDIPADRVATMRKAFDDTMKDPEFLAEADARKFEIDPLSGEDIHKLLKELFASPKDVIDRVAAFRNAGQKQ
jgi:tripartite-type tricarboxylate transporter receptor subunit TctC